jgi:hypothetical protein
VCACAKACSFVPLSGIYVRNISVKKKKRKKKEKKRKEKKERKYK